MIIKQSRPSWSLALFSLLFLASCASLPGGDGRVGSTKLSDKEVVSLVQKGDEALARQAYSDAQVQYALAIKEQPDNIELMYKLSIVHYEKESYEVARELLRSILSKDARHIGANEMLGLVALKSENLRLAELSLGKALSIDSTRWRSQNAMGIVKDLQSKHAEAVQHFQMALRNSPDKAQTQNNIGYSYYLSGNYSDAENHFRKATQINPNNDKAWANLGLVFVRSKRFEDARYAFAKVVDGHKVSNNLGYLSMIQGDEEIARQELNRAIVLAPTYYPTASENLASLNNRGAASTIIDRMPDDVGASEIVIKESAFKASPTKEKSSAVKLAATPVVAAIAKEPATKRSSVSNKVYKQYLNLLGFDSGGSADELYSSILSFQANYQLDATGKLNKASRKMLSIQAIRRVKVLLASMSYKASVDKPGLDAETIAGLKQFQKNNALPITGKLDRLTLSEFLRHQNGGSVVFNKR